MLPPVPPADGPGAEAQGRIGFIAPILQHRDDNGTGAAAAVGLRVEGATADWTARLALWQLGLARPQAREWQARGAIARSFFPGAPALGLGLWARGGTAPTRPWLTGLELVGSGHWRLGRGLVLGGLSDWGLGFSGGLTPSGLAWGDPRGALASARFEVALDREHGPLRLGLGYRRWWLGGTGFFEVFEGPFLSVSLDDRAWRDGAP